MVSSTSPTYYTGWKNLFASFICAALAIGLTSYIFGLFALPVSEELGISRASYNNGMIALMVGMAIVSPVVGHMLDGFSARKLLLIGGVTFGASLILISQLHTIWIMLVILALPLAFAVGSCGMISANTVTVRWFRARRGRALGILALSTSVGGFVFQPLTALLIEQLGWRDALFSLGLLAMAVILAMGCFVLRDRPKGDEPGYNTEFATTSHSESQATSSEARVWTKRELLRNRNFWILAICIGILFGIDQAVLVSQVPFFQDLGIDLTTAALLVSVKTISAIAGKLLIGYLADRVDLRLLFVYVAGCNAILMTIYISQPSLWVLFIAVALLGVAIGGVVPMWTTLMAWLFGPNSYGTVMGFMSVICQPFAVVMLRFVGQMYDKTGSYIAPFTTFIFLALTAIVLIWFLKPDTPEDKQTVAGTTLDSVSAG